MEFLVLGYDGDDEGALDRRMAVREDHLALGDRMEESGNLLFAAAILDESGERMVGSAMVVDFPSRQDVDGWLEIEPYVVGDVWRRVEVSRCRPAVVPKS